jgi:hypothetical protein
MEKTLTKEQITQALTRLAQLANEHGQQINITIYGGTALMLAYKNRDVTQDVDAIAKPQDITDKLAKIVAKEHNLPTDWLNNDVYTFLSFRGQTKPLNPQPIKGLKLEVPTPAYLLAMKLNAGRKACKISKGDEQDILFLLNELKITSLQEAKEIHAHFFPLDTLKPTSIKMILLHLEKNKEKTTPDPTPEQNNEPTIGMS